MWCRAKMKIKEYREWQLKMYTRFEDTLEVRLAGVKAARAKLEEQMGRDNVEEVAPID
tara:strand:- start:1083 stop:1256 length:174 start_codon:yes stop_codon:yes gene_type:complete